MTGKSELPCNSGFCCQGQAGISGKLARNVIAGTQLRADTDAVARIFGELDTGAAKIARAIESWKTDGSDRQRLKLKN